MGWNVVPFSMHHPENENTKWDSYFINEIEFGSEYSLLRKLTFVPKVIYSFEARSKLKELIDLIKPNVCHAHNIYHHITPSILSLLSKRDIPVFLTLHDLKLACPAYTMLTHDGVCERCNGGSLYNVVKHKCIKQSKSLSSIVYAESLLHKILKTYIENTVKLIAPSNFYIDKFVDWGFERNKFIHIPNFVQFHSTPASNDVGKSFLYFGRLSPEKGLVTMLKAASVAKVPVWIIGKGVMETELRNLANKLNINAQFFGYLSGEKLYDKIRSARAVVLPSEWYENAPLTLMESYALAVPVIGASIGGIPELVKDNETGLLYTSGSAENLAEAMIKMTKLSNLQVREMGRCGRLWMQSEFSVDIYKSRLIDLYSKFGIL